MARHLDYESAQDDHQGGEKDAALLEAEGHRQNADANDAVGQRDHRFQRHFGLGAPLSLIHQTFRLYIFAPSRLALLETRQSSVLLFI